MDFLYIYNYSLRVEKSSSAHLVWCVKLNQLNYFRLKNCILAHPEHADLFSQTFMLKNNDIGKN